MIPVRFKSEVGLTLIEMLIASSLFLVVMGATLTAFDTFITNNRDNERQNDQQQAARTAIDQMVKQLRNLANPTTSVPTINYADPYRLVFQTTDPTKQWVSYCLQTVDRPGLPASTSDGVLWYQTSAKATIADQATALCPSESESDDPATLANANTPDWGSRTRLLDHVTNRLPSDRGLFQYAGFEGATVATGAGGAVTDTSVITRVTATLFVDVNTNQPPGESTIKSGAHMRNQNQSPVASFATLSNGSTFTFDASESSDAERRTLAYFWYSTPSVPTAAQIPPTASTTPQSELPSCSGSDQSETIPSAGGVTWTCLGTGVVLTHQFNAGSDGSPPRYVWLMVVDPGGLATLSKTTTGGGCSLHTLPAASLDQTTCREVTY